MQESTFLGKGWSFPPTFTLPDYRLSMTEGEVNIKQSIDLILQTPRGSRPLQPDFGSDLRRFLFQHIDATMKEEIRQSVMQTLLNNEPRIGVDQVTVTLLPDDAATVALAIHYIVKQSNTRHNHVFPFSLLEGTNLFSR